MTTMSDKVKATLGMTVDERFHYYTEKTVSCWIWKGGTYSRGYGCFADGSGKSVRAHRFSFQKFKSPIPKGMFVCHSCDNPSCVNPDHLFLGSHKENMLDKMKKGRAPSGDHHVSSKLSEKDINHIQRLAGKLSQEKIASMFGVTQSHISNIMKGKTRHRKTAIEMYVSRTDLKLSDNQVIEIRALYPQFTQREIAAKFGISRQYAGEIINSKKRISCSDHTPLRE